MHLVAKTMSCITVLKDKGYRLTPQRRLILDVLHGSAGHLSAQDILNQVQAVAPDVNKSTIYRNLELLEELGLAVRSELEGRFVYHHADEGSHHHLVCRQCGRTIACDSDMLMALEKRLLKEFQFEGDLKHLVIHGVCNACRGKGN